MKGHRNGYRRALPTLLHDSVATLLPDAANPCCSRIRQTSEPERTRSLPNRHLRLSDKTSSWRRRATSKGEAVSKNNSSASIKLIRASSIEAPWLATSYSGHNATNPSSSRSIIAVKRCAAFTNRVYTSSGGRNVPYPRGYVEWARCSTLRARDTEVANAKAGNGARQPKREPIRFSSRLGVFA